MNREFLTPSRPRLRWPQQKPLDLQHAAEQTSLSLPYGFGLHEHASFSSTQLVSTNIKLLSKRSVYEAFCRSLKRTQSVDEPRIPQEEWTIQFQSKSILISSGLTQVLSVKPQSISGSLRVFPQVPSKHLWDMKLLSTISVRKSRKNRFALYAKIKALASPTALTNALNDGVLENIPCESNSL